ncbi:hypothetical protein TMatcc_000497 [Talaromyces marneffei ATCC 18224]
MTTLYTEHEDQCSDDKNWDVANDNRPNDHDPSRSCCQHNTSQSRIAAAVNEQQAVEPDNVFVMPCAINSRSTLKLSSPVDIPRAGTLIGTCRTPKKKCHHGLDAAGGSNTQPPARKIVLQRPRQSRRDFDSGSYQKPSDSADAADQNMAREEPYQRAQLEHAHEKENDSCQYRAERERQNRRRKNGSRIIFTDSIENHKGHLMEKGNNFNHLTTNSAFKHGRSGRENQLRDNRTDIEDGYTVGAQVGKYGFTEREQNHAVG